MSVTKSPKVAYHSIYFGAPNSAPSSIKSKSNTRFKDAITTTNKLIPMLNKDVLLGLRIDIPDPNILMMKLTKYMIAIPPVAATTPSLKFSVGFISPVLYASNKAANIPNVRKTAWLTIPGY